MSAREEKLKKRVSRLSRSEAIYRMHVKASNLFAKELWNENKALKKRIKMLEGALLQLRDEQSLETLRMTFRISPTQGSSFLATIEPDGYQFSELNRKGSKVIVTYTRKS